MTTKAERMLDDAATANDDGDAPRALALAEKALRLDPSLSGARFERAFALFELCRFDDARAELARAQTADPEEPFGFHLAGLLAERRGEAGVARRAFAEARRLAPEDYPKPPELSEARFDAVVEEALERLPPSVRDYLANVPITVEPVPSDDDLLGSDPPLSPQILGLFRGAPYGQKGAGDPWSHFPSSIVLYQRNLERVARDHEELVEEIDTTLLHEVGHFLGLDEDELAGRGLD